MIAFAIVVSLLVASNLFMTYAWYGHLKDLTGYPCYLAVLVSWGIAFFEYLLQVPANRFGDTHGFQLGQLKIIHEAVTLSVFVPFSIIYMQRPLSLNSCGRDCVCAVRCISCSVRKFCDQVALSEASRSLKRLITSA